MIKHHISLGEEETDGYSGSTPVQDGISQARADVTIGKARKPRPLTWANEEDFSSECNSLSAFGSNRQRMMGIIPENMDWNRNRCYGDEGKSLISSPLEYVSVGGRLNKY